MGLEETGNLLNARQAPTLHFNLHQANTVQTRPSGSPVDGVSIVAFLNRLTGSEILLEKQYRPSIDQFVVELPAGLIDPGETIEQTAVRELKEETGYIGVADQTSGIMYNGLYSDGLAEHDWFDTDPGFCNTNLNLVYVQVDMTLPDNQSPKPDLEDNEFIECFTVPVSQLYAELQKLGSEGYAIDARVGSMAAGIEIAKKLRIWDLRDGAVS